MLMINSIEASCSLLLFFSLTAILGHIDDSIYLTNTEDGEHIEAFDCFDHKSQRYCRRPKHPITLKRDHSDQSCFGDGVRYYFDDLIVNQTSPSTILHSWRSTLEKVEDYTEYRDANRSPLSNITWLCHCVHPQSFGKYCEYQLPLRTTIAQLIATKFVETGKKLNYEGDIVCYGTLSCDYGLLCLDWRDICDGLQQCMYGLDETNCEEIEFNECEEDEYRCRNGMCIPDEFFLDGDYDCMDTSDEKEKFDSSNCAYREATLTCDDRMINQVASNRADGWSCGDGQEIKTRDAGASFGVQHNCVNRRNQFFWCETVRSEILWTLPNGRCSQTLVYNRDNLTECCYFLKICLSLSTVITRPACEEVKRTYGASSGRSCESSIPRHYPHAALVLPFAFSDYSLLHLLFEKDKWLFKGTVKCIQGQSTFSTQFNVSRNSFDLLNFNLYHQRSLCMADQNNVRVCLDLTKFFSNRSVSHPAVCQYRATCSSAYRTEVQYCDDTSYIDEETFSDFISQTCHRFYKYRFRCSDTELRCLFVHRLGDGSQDCDNKHDEQLFGKGLLLSKMTCSPSKRYNCRLLRQHIPSSWNSTTRNISGLTSRLGVEMPFRYFCDTIDDLTDGSDEMQCEHWICSRQQFQCANGQCIEKYWLFDRIWDCSDGSDEENFFHQFIQRNQSLDLLHDQYARIFAQKYPNRSFWIDCSLVNQSTSDARWMSIVSQPRQICFNATSHMNEHVDYSSSCDERSVLDYCSRSLRKVYSSFKYLSISICTAYSKQFSADKNAPCSCWNGRRHLCSPQSVFQCWSENRTVARCRGTSECPNGEDLFLCSSSLMNYRDWKIAHLREQQLVLQLESDESPSTFSTQLSTQSSPIKSTTEFNLHNDRTSLNRCNRGLAIRVNDSHEVCFCPP